MVGYINNSQSPVKNPKQMLFDMLYDIRLSGFLSVKLAKRDIAAKYKQTFLGYFWAILQPLVTAFLFIFLNRSNILNIPESSIPYPIYVITGTTLWQLFVDAMNAPINQINNNISMLTKINFAKEALVLSGLLQVLFSFVIKIGLLILVFAFFQTPLKWTSVFIIPPIIAILALGSVIGILITPIGVLFKDIQQIITVIAPPLMLLSPVVYPPPESGLLGLIMKFNPMTPLLQIVRDYLFVGASSHLFTSAIVFVVTIVILVFSWMIYRIVFPVLIERMDA